MAQGSLAQAVLTLPGFESPCHHLLAVVLQVTTEPPGALVSPPVKWEINAISQDPPHSTVLGVVKKKKPQKLIRII